MAFDKDNHSESEFYYHDETEKYNEKKLSARYVTKTIKVLNSQWTVCKSI